MRRSIYFHTGLCIGNSNFDIDIWTACSFILLAPDTCQNLDSLKEMDAVWTNRKLLGRKVQLEVLEAVYRGFVANIDLENKCLTLRKG